MDFMYKTLQEFKTQKYNIIIILILISLARTTSIQAQTFLSFNTDSITIEWTHSYKNTEGGQTFITHFIVKEILNDSTVLNSYPTSKDSINFKPIPNIKIPTPTNPGKIIYSVTAIDIAQNQSIPHFSTDLTAALNGWSLINIKNPPEKATNIQPK